MRKEKAPKFKKDFADDEDEGGVTDLRRIDEDAGDDDHNRTMKIILSGLEATAILEQDAAKKKSQVDINSRLAKPSARFRLFGQADEVEGTHQPHLPGPPHLPCKSLQLLKTGGCVCSLPAAPVPWGFVRRRWCAEPSVACNTEGSS